jgi:hypothetical protein
MLIIRDTALNTSVRMGKIMSDLRILAVSTRGSLLEIAKQAAALGTGLQNAAPGDKTGTPNNSVQYLLAISAGLNKIALECEQFAAHDSHEPKPGPSM